MKNLLEVNSEKPSVLAELDLAGISIQLLNLSIKLLDGTPHSVAACHAQMARDLLAQAICPEIGFSCATNSGGRP